MKIDQKQEFHTPVLLNEVIEGLKVKVGKYYIDATAGGGGHTQEILNHDGLVLSLDQDIDAINELNLKFEKEIETGKLIVKQGNFGYLKKITEKIHLNKVLGIIFDLGLSTYQIKKSGRGFSFNLDENLDMRMSLKETITAAEIINQYSQKDLYDIFRIFGEENLAGQIAYAVCRARAVSQITRTSQLREIIQNVYQDSRIHTKINPATKVFQALRIAVNNELDNLRQGLRQAVEILESGGRCLVISFHSLEDRIVKQFFNEMVNENLGILINKKPVRATEQEIRQNRSARSAKLRIFEKI